MLRVVIKRGAPKSADSSIGIVNLFPVFSRHAQFSSRNSSSPVGVPGAKLHFSLALHTQSVLTIFFYGKLFQMQFECLKTSFFNG